MQRLPFLEALSSPLLINQLFLGGSQTTLFSGSGGGQMSSTLVETVSINYEDFSEYFLTCGTCLCSYDGSQHNPKVFLLYYYYFFFGKGFLFYDGSQHSPKVRCCCFLNLKVVKLKFTPLPQLLPCFKVVQLNFIPFPQLLPL